MSFNPLPYTPDDGSGPEASDAEVTASVAAAVAALVSGAPGALDTLNELAAALGDDANFAATITTALAGKSATGHAHSGTLVAADFDAAGDLLVGTGADAYARMAKGTALQVLRVNAGATALEYATPAAGGGGNAIFGDGSDGTVNISGTTTITRDMYYDVLTVQSGGVLKTANCRVFCKTSCTVDAGGSININGVNAATPAGNGGGTATPALSLNGAAASGGNGGNSSVGSAGTGISFRSLGGAGGAGGAGASAGGAGGTVTGPSASAGGIRSLPDALQGAFLGQTLSGKAAGGAGGGGGGSDGANLGGGGGAGAGVLVLAAKALTNNGTITATGGDGGPGNAGNAGGGGGGGGGLIILAYNTFSGNAATAAGGTKGLKAGTGIDGVNGSAGTVISLANA